MTRSVHRLSRIRLTCSVPSSDLFSHVCDLCLFNFTQMFVFLSRYVIYNKLLSVFVWAAASLVFGWVVNAHVSAPYVIAGSTHELWICLFKHVPMLPLKMSRFLALSGRDFSLNLLVFVFDSGAISLSQADVAFTVLNLSVVDIYCFHHHLCLRPVHLGT